MPQNQPDNEASLNVGRYPSEIRINTTLALSIIIGGLFNTGMMYQQFQQIKEEQRMSALLVSTIRENQIIEIASLSSIKTEQAMQSGRTDRIDKRLIVVEGHLMNQGNKK